MCNLYRHEGAVEAIRQFAAAMGRAFRTSPATGNLPPDYVGADSDGPILTNTDGDLLLDNARWGFPPAKQGAKPITNIRNLKSRWWRDVNRPYFLEAEYRCLVPFTRFAEWNAAEKANAWFQPVDQPAFFAGIWRPWTGERLVKVDGQKRRQRVTQDFTLYAFLTCEPN
ncbi:MAG: SOS response-associated peptidase family protein, partial [Pseudomonadota bacterium]